jgi:hypothetical protein
MVLHFLAGSIWITSPEEHHVSLRQLRGYKLGEGRVEQVVDAYGDVSEFNRLTATKRGPVRDDRDLIDHMVR